ncbi:MAG TPA: hypothetical protein VGR28_11675 [Candidatus Thermoplasmatota archaeon]|jgi:hypothetical protein|nr:hypothetical protein [Candidatus Thermoplasmatota archaeon]
MSLRPLAVAGLLLALAAAPAPASGAMAADCDAGWACGPAVGTIQPGARLTNGCTMNFIVRDAQGRLYFGTAGHCGDVGETLGVVDVGDAVATVVYDRYWDGGMDFALARIDESFRGAVDPTLLHWGGPVGLAAGDPELFEVTFHYGWGNVYNVSETTRARVGVVLGWDDAEFSYLGFAQPGDSGAPILDQDGRALGLHVRSSLGVELPEVGDLRVDPSYKFAVRLDAALAQAEAATHLQFAVVPGTIAPCMIPTAWSLLDDPSHAHVVLRGCVGLAE